jgi:tRNA threonylcarbamoyladenosine biosynthesis protein TsaB
MILAAKTDADLAELYLLDNGGAKKAQTIWTAGRHLERDLLKEIEQLVSSGVNQAKPANPWQNLSGLVVYTGPGSFTGLRIGITTLNSLAYGLKIPIVGSHHHDWLTTGWKRLAAAENDTIVRPLYGAPPHIS